MNCKCHGEPGQWRTDSRYLAGGYTVCAVRERERARDYYELHRERICQNRQDRYDADPIHRIGKRLADDRRKRAASLTRLKEHLGKVSL